MKPTLALIGGSLALIAAFPYIVDVVRGKTHPNLVTWVTLTLVNVITAWATFSSGAIPAALQAAFAAGGTAAITTLGLHHGVKRYTPFDIVCQALALAGLIVWQLSHNPAIAVTIAEAVVIVGFLPTVRHAWLKPFEETWQGFAIASFGGLLTLASLTAFTYISLLSPIIFLGTSVGLAALILLRRRARRPSAQPAPE